MEMEKTVMKTAPTYYTYEMRRIAKENIEKFDWARSARDGAVEQADRYLDVVESYYDLIVYEGIPRSRQALPPSRSGRSSCARTEPTQRIVSG